MKINWGHGILLTIVLSSLGFIYLVVLSSREQIDLVTEEYYPKGLVYDNEMEKIRNTKRLETPVQVSLDDTYLQIVFPDIVDNPDSIRGMLWVYYPANKSSDRNLSVVADSLYRFRVPVGELDPGRCDVIIDWRVPGNHFLHKERIIISP